MPVQIIKTEGEISMCNFPDGNDISAIDLDAKCFYFIWTAMFFSETYDQSILHFLCVHKVCVYVFSLKLYPQLTHVLWIVFALFSLSTKCQH